MGINIHQGLRRILNTNQEINSILITDQDGVPVVTGGDPVRNVATLTSSYVTALDQSMKLNLGPMNIWTFYYEAQQIVIFARSPFVVYIMAQPQANNAALASLLDSHLKPILDELKVIHTQVIASCPPLPVYD
uniref:Roadblock/LAMTOR2 domain-containing protein n=1 Tax=Panagrolaimus sp. ES5 TaxID=591445 RepID=A0AC34FBD4_9BILA